MRRAKRLRELFAILLFVSLLFMLFLDGRSKNIDRKNRETLQKHYVYLVNNHTFFGRENNGYVHIAEDIACVSGAQCRRLKITEDNTPEIVKTLEQEKGITLVGEPQIALVSDASKSRIRFAVFSFSYESNTQVKKRRQITALVR